MKINFKQPRYIIPLLLLPFILLFYYVFVNWGGAAKTTAVTTDSTGNNKGINSINTDMPGVSKEVASGDIKDKFAAYQEAYKNDRDYSALNGIDPMQHTGDNPAENSPSSYNNEDIQRLASSRKLDSLNTILKMGQQDIDRQMAAINNENQNYKDDNSGKKYRHQKPPSDPFTAQPDQLNNSNTANENNKTDGDNYDDQMKLFRDQMGIMDSMQQKYTGDAGHTKQNKNLMAGNNDKGIFDPSKDTTFKPLLISMSKKENGKFNTIRGFSEEQHIMAIIDQNIKATLGSRVRIRLLSDIFAGDYAIPKGTYIYGVVTGFQTQRVNISITQLFYNSTPIPVKLDVFDNDGYLGLYVPGSNFREFSKEIGTQGTNGLSSIQASDNSNVVTGIATQLFQKTTTSVANLIKKDKAFLKYNYIIYLKEKK
jgi:conjugative transposon TraM protein